MNQDEFDLKYEYVEKTRSYKDFLNSMVPKVNMAREFSSFVRDRLPILHWIPKYSMNLAISDVAAGITLAIYNVPQAMAYSVLAGLPPVYGLYVSFFCPVLYCVFGSSRHVSVGVFSITCLMVHAARSKILPDNKVDDPDYNYKGDSENQLGLSLSLGLTDLTPENIATSLTLLTGLFQLILAVCRLDFVMQYLSDTAVSGLIFGAAIQSFIAQLPNILGVKLKKDDRDVFKLFYQIYEICEKIPESNLATVFIAGATLLTLIVSKIFIESRKMNCFANISMPFPTELIVIVIMTIVSYSINLNLNYNVKIVASVPTGFPPAEVPRFDVMRHLIVSAMSMAVVSFVITLSLCKLFAKKHRYTVSRRQMSGLFSAICILTLIMWLGKLLEPLPLCVLSCIVVVAIRSLLFKIKELPRLIRFSKIDAIIWIATALTTISLDIIPGVTTGIAVGLFLTAVRTMTQHVVKLGQCDTEYCELDKYRLVKNTRFQILRFEQSVVFTNVEAFVAVMMELSKEIALRKNHIENQDKLEDLELDQKPTTEGSWHAVILDCSTWTHTDAMGVDALIDINDNYEGRKILLVLANIGVGLRQQYKSAGVFKKLKPCQFYPNILSAQTAAEQLVENGQAFFKIEEKLNIKVG